MSGDFQRVIVGIAGTLFSEDTGGQSGCVSLGASAMKYLKTAKKVAAQVNRVARLPDGPEFFRGEAGIAAIMT
jgi:hypothetical protein